MDGFSFEMMRQNKAASGDDAVWHSVVMILPVLE